MSGDPFLTRLAMVADRLGWSEAYLEQVARLISETGTEATFLVDGGSTLAPGPASADSATVAFDEWAPAAPAAAPAPQAPLHRYEARGRLGAGGMGEVLRVWDRRLGRTVAMKVLRAELMRSAAAVARFLDEAQATAQLEHPGIMPVHDVGHLPDGRAYFTMTEVRGRTLGQAIREHREAADPAVSLRRLVDVLLRVCEAVAYAHARGVTHRDLKPDNVMLGPFGEVLVLDWGLAKVRGALVDDGVLVDDGSVEAVSTDRSRSGAHLTRVGVVAGTPAYMAPEQAAGAVDRIGPAADVYALGAVLYEILAGGRPYAGEPDVLAAVRAGPPAPLRPAGLEVPELVELCGRAMARQPEERPADASLVADALRAWLDGSRRREQALAAVREADALGAEAEALRARAAGLRREARALLDELPSFAPAERKQPGWELEDRASHLVQRSAVLEQERQQHLRAALRHLPDLPEALDRFADHYAALHREAEAARSAAGAAQYALLLAEHDRGRGRYAAYLDGAGTLTLATDPPCAEVALYRFEERRRRLEPVPVGTLGVTPLREVPLAMGSYLLELSAPGRRTVRYPVHIGRQERWDGVRPGASEPLAVRLPREDELGHDEIYVPGGWALVGGDPAVNHGLARQRVWVDGFAISRHPVTNEQYLAFLDGLVRQGREDEALRHAPQVRGSAEEAAQIYGRDERGRFVLRPDADGDVWHPRWPVLLVDAVAAWAYAAWRAEREGRGYRLPGELEWEKAARGADGRLFPFGDFLDPTWCCVRGSAPRSLPAEVEAFPLDVSPYGVRHLAGNVRELCGDRWQLEGPPLADGVALPPPIPSLGSLRPQDQVVTRGGTWASSLRLARSADRDLTGVFARDENLGFRIARSL